MHNFINMGCYFNVTFVFIPMNSSNETLLKNSCRGLSGIDFIKHGVQVANQSLIKLREKCRLTEFLHGGTGLRPRSVFRSRQDASATIKYFLILLNLMTLGCKPEPARVILPYLNTECTGFEIINYGKMFIPRNQSKRVLLGKRCNPNVIFRDRHSFFL